ncbi:sortase-dependent protein [Streptomyces sp. NPDC002588]|uniref:sortase-dependent protein n=1 Tax=Streptomyces sp. NPDC002588 TaxID=3154419 RepID=UPI00331D74B5
MSTAGLGALAVTGAALLMSAAPAFADGQSASPVPSTATKSSGTPVSEAASPVPSIEKTADASTAPTDDDLASTPEPSQVGRVPKGAADTGVEKPSEGNGGLVGVGSAAAAFAVAGAGFYVVRRRRATGA